MKTISSIVCIGHWNVRIFTPNWVYKYVFNIQNEKSMDVKLQNNSSSVQYRYDAIDFSVSDNKLELKTNSDDKRILNEIERIFKNITILLNHTPIFAIGYNIVCDLDETERKESNLFNKLTNETKYCDYSLQSETLFKKNGVFDCSIILSLNNSGGRIVCNYQLKSLSEIPEEGVVYSLIKKDYKELFNYEL